MISVGHTKVKSKGSARTRDPAALAQVDLSCAGALLRATRARREARAPWCVAKSTAQAGVCGWRARREPKRRRTRREHAQRNGARARRTKEEHRPLARVEVLLERDGLKLVADDGCRRKVGRDVARAEEARGAQGGQAHEQR